jgi:predicted TPR repeat methyltransferase
MGNAVAESWDAEYATGTRYAPDEPAVSFVDDILALARKHGIERGLYVGAGNGRNFIPMSEAGLELIGLDISAVAIDQLKERAPRYADRLLLGDLSRLPNGARFPLVVALQVLQHGDRQQVHGLLARCLERVENGGVFAIRVNGSGTDVRYSHEIVERAESGSFAVRYTEGPKQGLTVFFWAAVELDRAIRAAGLAPLLCLRPQSTWRNPAMLGQWLQWEGIYRKGPDFAS